jgi:hypothetical protein
MSSSVANALETLGLAPGASFAQVKEAYRDLAQVWHPDRFAGNPRLQDKAAETLKAINLAYETLTQVVPSRDDFTFEQTGFSDTREAEETIILDIPANMGRLVLTNLGVYLMRKGQGGLGLEDSNPDMFLSFDQIKNVTVSPPGLIVSGFIRIVPHGVPDAPLGAWDSAGDSYSVAFRNKHAAAINALRHGILERIRPA